MLLKENVVNFVGNDIAMERIFVLTTVLWQFNVEY